MVELFDKTHSWTKDVRKESSAPITSSPAPAARVSLTTTATGALLHMRRTGEDNDAFSAELTAAEVERYRRSFTVWSAGEAVRLDRFLAVMRSLAAERGLPFSEARARATFALADVDQNGAVDLPEYVLMQLQKRRQSERGSRSSSELSPSSIMAAPPLLDEMGPWNEAGAAKQGAAPSDTPSDTPPTRGRDACLRTASPPTSGAVTRAGSDLPSPNAKSRDRGMAAKREAEAPLAESGAASAATSPRLVTEAGACVHPSIPRLRLNALVPSPPSCSPLCSPVSARSESVYGSPSQSSPPDLIVESVATADERMGLDPRRAIDEREGASAAGVPRAVTTAPPLPRQLPRASNDAAPPSPRQLPRAPNDAAPPSPRQLPRAPNDAAPPSPRQLPRAPNDAAPPSPCPRVRSSCHERAADDAVPAASPRAVSGGALPPLPSPRAREQLRL